MTALITGTLAAATGAGLGVRVLTSPPTLVTGIVQAVALLALVLGVLLLILGFALEGRDLPPGAGSTRTVRRATVGAIALIVAGAAVAGWSG